jgi:mycofactocin precursor
VSNPQTLKADPATTTEAAEGEALNDVYGEPAAPQLVEETLVEEVSIDGMCGVY